MTRDEFLARLAETPRDWAVDKEGYLRNAHDQCPICAVAGRDDNQQFLDAARELGLPEDEAFDIVERADSEPNDESDWDYFEKSQRRNELLVACGVQPFGKRAAQ